MLLALTVQNFAIIEHLNIEFADGLNVLTGETGAGKSIIVDALSLALGYRSSSDTIRTGKDKIVVQALFAMDYIDPQLELIFEQYGINIENNSILLSREIYRNGRNICRANDTLVNVSNLREMSAFLVDIHGQHEHQKLLNQNTHINVLDAYAGDVVELKKQITSKAYLSMMQAKEYYQNLVQKEKNAKEKEEELTEKLSEIRSLDLQISEDELLEQRKKILSNSEKLYAYIDNAYSLLYNDDSNINDNLAECVDNLKLAAEIDIQLAKDTNDLYESSIIIQEIIYTLRDYKDSIEFNPQELDTIQDRLNKINNLKRKYGATIEEILAEADNFEEQLNLIKDSEKEIQKALTHLKQCEEDYIKHAVILSNQRKQAAEQLSKRMIAILSELAMPNAAFQIDFTDNNTQNPVAYSSNGIDKVQFLISTNIGQELKPLTKIASGGEVSRIMLAIKSLLANTDRTGTLIFDEIDTGISGRTAQIVAEKMSALSTGHQILCITHLSQIASMADKHFLISKSSTSDDTFTNFEVLNKEGRIRELARMLGGVHVTETTMKHASEMLRLANELKNQHASY